VLRQFHHFLMTRCYIFIVLCCLFSFAAYAETSHTIDCNKTDPYNCSSSLQYNHAAAPSSTVEQHKQITFNSIFQSITQHPIHVLIYFFIPALLAIFAGFFHPRMVVLPKGLQYFYSIILYSVIIPCIFSCLLVLYALLLTRQNLLNVNVLIYFAPIVAALFTLSIVKRKVVLSRLLWVEQLIRVVILLFVGFFGIFLLTRLHIFVGFWGTLTQLALIGLVLFFGVKWLVKKLLG